MQELPTRVNHSAETQSHFQIPPLRVYHFLALTAVAAVLFTQLRPAFAAYAGIKDLSQLRYVFVAVSTLTSLGAAFAITATGFGLAWRWQGGAYPFHPGHWLLLVTAALHILHSVTAALTPALAYGLLVHWLSSGVCALFCIYIGAKHCGLRRWSWVFYVKALATILPILGDLFLLVMISRAGLIDRKDRVERDWLHHSGVILQVLTSLLMVGMFVAMMLVFASRF